MQVSRVSEDEVITGIILRGKQSTIEKIIEGLERDKNIRLVYVRRGSSGSFLLVIETRKVRGMMNAFNR